ncbi:DUF4041 domain-containing protein [Flavobacterium oreochromis]|uniref:DUF4041 domain-containing protein n=1 Tax=Flavobacterium oreochromis TaxID=2906078 RepID=UPI001CE5C156|nr:DUF4041 domain-containing protein [Flavobacterium oreochromis]QYS85424.1 DUF4041 domain-containing protein [Flavobacterium oreochromis]
MGFILFLAVIIMTVVLINNKKKYKKIIADLELKAKSLSSEIELLEKEKAVLTEKNSILEENINSLKKYQGIVDVEQTAKDILLKANLEANDILETAKQNLDQAVSEAKLTKSKANADALLLKENATSLLNNSTEEAKQIIETAERKAEEIAGDAFKALQDSKEYERTAKAMKNIIEGYGDQYLIPTYSLLDNLAEDFKHTEAGEKLKFCREKTRLMVKNETYAKCDYVEANRKQIAMSFVLDAFNGKVDSILSQVKKDNYGTLEQKIKDSYQLVNNNGKAFRNAVITEEYLQARIDELKWAVIAQELKWKDQEEQKILRDQIREEERARREYEKAIKEAQKEEETLKKLIEKAQKEASQANDEQRLELEQKLRELEDKLQLAEDKNKRALSMAQQTKSGNVYIISNIGSFGENVFKIGMTRRLDPLDRVRELGDASVPFEFDVHSMIFSDDAPKLEKELHKNSCFLN